MEIKGFATAAWLILHNFLSWRRLLIMMLTTQSSTGTLCTHTHPLPLACLHNSLRLALVIEIQRYVDATQYLYWL